MDHYNPLYDSYKEGKIKDTELALNEQNLIYGAQHWYPLLTNVTPESYLFELSDNERKVLSIGITIPDNIEFRTSIENLISKYQFVKTTHKSAHVFKPINNFQDFKEQILHPSITMSFRNYNCKFLLFRKWTEMNLECRVYVFKNQIRYVEVYRDEKKEFQVDMFPSIIQFVAEQVIPKLSAIYESFTVDVFYNGGTNWQVVEINSPLWLKCGAHLIKYEWEKDRIHETSVPICRYTTVSQKEGEDSSKEEVMEI